MTVRELLSDPNRWTKCAHARDADGKAVLWTSDEAVCFCLAGAIDRCFRDDPHGKQLAWDKVYAVVVKRGLGVTGFNDSITTTHKDILAVLDEAGV